MTLAKSTAWAWMGLIGAAIAVSCAQGEDVHGGTGAGAGGVLGVGGNRLPPGAGAAGFTAGSASGGTSGTGLVAGTSGIEAGAGGASGTPQEPEACLSSDGGAAATGPLEVQLRANSDHPTDYVQGELSVMNDADESIELSTLELRYYIDSEHTRAQTDAFVVFVDYAEVRGRVYRPITQFVEKDVVLLPNGGVSSADAYLSITFDPGAGTLELGETTRVQFRLAPPAGGNDYYSTPVNQTNDYSFGACPLRAAPWPRLVLLRDHVLTSGELPPGIGGEGGQGGQGGEGGEGGQAGEGGQGGAAGARL